MQSQRDRREWILLGAILLVGVVLMCAAGQIAIRPSRAWQVPADMGSKIDPDGSYHYSQGTLIIEPLEQDILTPVTWPGIYETATRPGDRPAPTRTATVYHTLTASPTTIPSITPSLTLTRTPTASQTIYVPTLTPTWTYTPIPRGTIVIIENSVMNDVQDFTYTSPTLGTFSLDDDFGDPTLSNTRTLINVVAGPRTLTQNMPANWNLTGLTCSDPDGGTTVDIAARTVSIDLDNNETVTCTFTNTDLRLGTITIVEGSLPGDAQDFSFGGSLGSFSLDDDGDATLPNSRTVGLLIPGTYTVSENSPSPAPWDLTGLICDDGSSTNVGTRTATIVLNDAEHVTCTFINSHRGSITIVENSILPGTTVFGFTGALGSFPLADSSTTFGNLPVGSYAVSELPTAGWSLTGLSCSDGSPVGGSTATIGLGAAENVTCTFTNRDNSLGTITIVEDNVPNGGTSFSFDGDLGSFSLADSSRTFDPLAPGTYVVNQTAIAGWDTVASCDDGSILPNIVLDGTGENVTCTFTNTQRGRIRIVENSMPDNAQNFTFSPSWAAPFTLNDDGSGSNVADFPNLLAGGYTVIESNPGPTWSLSLLSCTDLTGGTTWDVGTLTATITVNYGDDVVCTFINTFNFPNINIGGPDTNISTLPDGYSWWSSLFSTPIRMHGDNNWDLVYYELRVTTPLPPFDGINMDFVVVEISPDNNTWYTVLAWRTSLPVYANTSLNGYPVNDNEPVPTTSLVNNTGVGIDIDALGIPNVDYKYIRIISPGPGGDGCDVDSIFIVFP